MYIGMTEFWGDAQESYGPVTTDKIQTEFLSDTQTVTEWKVSDGDTVKKGDVLFSFDTTLDALTLERKRLDVEKIKVQIKAAEERLEDTRKLVPYVPPGETEPEEEDADLFREIDKWFSEILPYPPQCKRQEPVVCFFKTENTDEMMRLIGPAMWLLEKYNHPFYVVYTNSPGEIVYEDRYQVAVKVDREVLVEAIQESWTPADA
jgi:hypothetical protein